ncbi:hypothetical protein ANCDUO_11221 [Ancylostoma duodenale]|uniref:Uncharacterized protein n=1 Tax=Ancylostoma duodenale TaxID=51022 RepID=A0A0C2GI66_9BILA|nr:hypothetical protein ANCDUO_11221 [Ancylostoma duodenale]
MTRTDVRNKYIYLIYLIHHAKATFKFNPAVWTPRGIAVTTLTATEGWRFASSIRRRFDRSQHNSLPKWALLARTNAENHCSVEMANVNVCSEERQE